MVDRGGGKPDQKQSRTSELNCQVGVRLSIEQSQVGKLRSGTLGLRVRRSMGNTRVQAYRPGQAGGKESVSK